MTDEIVRAGLDRKTNQDATSGFWRAMVNERGFAMLTPAQVRGARAMLEMKQEDLARAASTQRSVLAAFEGGQSTPREATMERIKAVLEGRGIAFIESEVGVGLMLATD